LRYLGRVAVAATPESRRLAAELVKRLGKESFTAGELAAELVAVDRPMELITAFEDALSSAAAADEPDELNERLWGSAPTEEDLAQARKIAQLAQRDALQTVLAGALTRQEAAELLGISPQAVSKRHAAGGLVAIARGREQYFPAWQFHEGAVLAGLAAVVRAFPGSALALSSWATTENTDLDGFTPERMLARLGGRERVLSAIDSISAEAW
jgi:hypothetical protein